MDGFELFRWAVIAANLVAMAANLWVMQRANRLSKRYVKNIREQLDSPYYHCSMYGHKLAFEAVILDSQQSPEFVFTHLCKLSCQRCEFTQLYEVRNHVYAPGVQRMEVSWTNPQPPAEGPAAP